MNDKTIAEKHINLLGFEGKDKVTGFTGVITTMSFDLYGCIQLVLTPKVQDGKQEYPNGNWFDITRIDITSHERAMDMPNYSKGYVSEGKKGAAEKPAMQ